MKMAWKILFPFCFLFVYISSERSEKRFILKSLGGPISRFYRAGRLAQGIHSQLLNTIPTTHSLYGKQLAWLYAGDDQPTPSFTDPTIQRMMNQEIILPEFERIYPLNPFNSNLVISRPLPSAFGKGSTNPIGHAEWEVLDVLDKMNEGYMSRNNGQCPPFIILGSDRDTCNFVRGKKSWGCSFKYLEKKQAFQSQFPDCPTDFVLYIHDPRENYQRFFERTKDMMRKNDVGVFTGNQQIPAIAGPQPSDTDTPVTQEQQPPEVTQQQQSPEVTQEQQSPEVTQQQQSPEVTQQQQSPEVTQEQQSPETSTTDVNNPPEENVVNQSPVSSQSSPNLNPVDTSPQSSMMDSPDLWHSSMKVNPVDTTLSKIKRKDSPRLSESSIHVNPIDTTLSKSRRKDSPRLSQSSIHVNPIDKTGNGGNEPNKPKRFHRMKHRYY